MPRLDELVNYCNSLLDIGRFQDYCPNGLQVEGRGEVRKMVTGVTASLALINAAIEARADLVLVHHGYFWKGEDASIVGIKRRRLKCLLQSDTSLLAYHLPLDAHAQFGNNVQLAQRLGIQMDAEPETGLVWQGTLPAPLSVEQFSAQIEQALGRQPLVIAAGDRPIQRIAWCSGAAQSYIQQAAEMGVDAYLSGEVSEQTYHLAKELGVDYFAAGHHATERYGVQALGQHLAERFDLEHIYIDLPNPV